MWAHFNGPCLFSITFKVLIFLLIVLYKLLKDSWIPGNTEMSFSWISAGHSSLFWYNKWFLLKHMVIDLAQQFVFPPLLVPKLKHNVGWQVKNKLLFWSQHAKCQDLKSLDWLISCANWLSCRLFTSQKLNLRKQRSMLSFSLWIIFFWFKTSGGPALGGPVFTACH